jgi:hypothetical protein
MSNGIMTTFPAPDQGDDRFSPAEMRAWAVLTDVRWRSRPVAEQVKAARVSRSHFFRIIRRPEFAEALRAHWRAVAQASLGTVIDALIANAALSGKDGDRSREFLLKIGGLLGDRGNPVSVSVTQQNASCAEMLAEAMQRAEPAHLMQLAASQDPSPPPRGEQPGT